MKALLVAFCLSCSTVAVADDAPSKSEVAAKIDLTPAINQSVGEKSDELSVVLREIDSAALTLETLEVGSAAAARATERVVKLKERSKEVQAELAVLESLRAEKVTNLRDLGQSNWAISGEHRALADPDTGIWAPGNYLRVIERDLRSGKLHTVSELWTWYPKSTDDAAVVREALDCLAHMIHDSETRLAYLEMRLRLTRPILAEGNRLFAAEMKRLEKKN